MSTERETTQPDAAERAAIELVTRLRPLQRLFDDDPYTARITAAQYIRHEADAESVAARILVALGLDGRFLPDERQYQEALDEIAALIRQGRKEASDSCVSCGKPVGPDAHTVGEHERPACDDCMDASWPVVDP